MVMKFNTNTEVFKEAIESLSGEVLVFSGALKKYPSHQLFSAQQDVTDKPLGVEKVTMSAYDPMTQSVRVEFRMFHGAYVIYDMGLHALEQEYGKTDWSRILDIATSLGEVVFPPYHTHQEAMPSVVLGGSHTGSLVTSSLANLLLPNSGGNIGSGGTLAGFSNFAKTNYQPEVFRRELVWLNLNEVNPKAQNTEVAEFSVYAHDSIPSGEPVLHMFEDCFKEFPYLRTIYPYSNFWREIVKW